MLAALFAFAAPASPTPYAPDHPRPNCERLYKLGLFKAQLRRSFSKTRWKDPTPVKPRERRVLRRYKRCAKTPWHARRMRQLERQARKAHRERRRKRLRAQRSDCIPGVTIYHGLGGCWAIPVHIVACESGGSWTAYNPSGARGPYQFLGWDVPWPVRTVEDKRAHHRFAAKLWAGGAGASNWVCA